MAAVQSRARDDLTISAPQLGKTVVLGAWLLGRMWSAGPQSIPWWWTAPTYAQVQDGFLVKFAGLCRSAGVLKSVVHSSPPRVVLDNDSWAEGRSWERPENLYGRTILGGVVDEFGWLTDPASAAISSRRAETGGPLRYAGNVGEIGGVAETLWRRAEAGEPGFACRRWTWHDRAAAHACPCGATAVLGQSRQHVLGCGRGRYLSFVEGEANRLPGPLFRQLYEAEWVDWNALPAYDFDRALHVSPTWEYDKQLPVHVACDFNVGPMAWVMGHAVNDRAWAFDEICIDGKATTAAAAEVLCGKLAKWGVDPGRREIVVYGDPAGKYGSTKSKDSDYDILLGRLRATFRNVREDVPAAHPPVATRLNTVNGRLRAADGTVRYGVHPRCVHLADDFARTALKQGTRELDKTDRRRTHFTDAEGYRICRLFPLDEPGQIVTHLTARARVEVPTVAEMAF